MYERIIRDDSWLDRAKHPAQQLGTLGGGNHFVEICLDKEDNVWAMLHSGSRGVGNRIGSYFTRQAKKACEDVELPAKDLAYLQEGTPGFARYMYAVDFAQKYAELSRQEMMRQVLWCLDLDGHMTRGRSRVMGEAIDCHHNYVQKERHFGRDVWITRKGAVSAQSGQLGIIPGSMGERSFIVRGKGNADSFCSCSHGAGRVMSRTRARKEITLEQHRAAVQGVESRIDESILDESPAAYKDIDAVMAAQSDLVEVVTEIKQVLCVKG
jgi:tRNA-splicing ligase RtcB